MRRKCLTWDEGSMIEITGADIRKESLRQGLDPDKWNYAKKSNGYCEIRKGFLGIGELIFEDVAALLVNTLNTQEALKCPPKP
jgi:hypothetical protein